MKPLVFTSDDLARTEEFLSSAYAPMRISSSSERPHAAITRSSAGSLSIDQLDLAFEMRYDVQPLGKVCLCSIQSGTVEGHRVEEWEPADSFGAGDTFAFAPPDRPYTGTICSSRYTITMFDPHLLDQVAATAPGSGSKTVRLLDHRPVTAAAGRQLQRAIDYLGSQLADPAVQGSPLLIAATERYLAACVLNAFPNTALTAPTITDVRDAHPATVRRAIAYIEAHAGNDISAADIADAARVTIRALQYAFRRHLGTTPMAHLNRVRLERARQDLLAADPTETTVSAVANRWGFGHLGRFAATYRDTYGTAPSTDLRA